MAITFQCAHCSQAIAVPEALGGKRGKCPGCGQVLVIPAAEGGSTIVAAAEPAPVAPSLSLSIACPACAEQIPAASATCPLCGEAVRGALGGPFAGRPLQRTGPVASARSRFAPRDLDVGRVLLGALQSTFAGAGVLVLLNVAMALPGVIAMQSVQQHFDSHGKPRRIEHLVPVLPMAGVTLLSLCVMTPIAAGAVAHATVRRLAGARVGLWECLAVGAARFPVVFGASILEALILIPALLACCVPGIVVITILAVVVPVAVCERVGVVGSLYRAAELSRGHRLQLFVVVFVLGAMALTMNIVAQTVELHAHLRAGPKLAFALGVVVVGAALGTLQACAMAVAYTELVSIEQQDGDRPLTV